MAREKQKKIRENIVKENLPDEVTSRPPEQEGTVKETQTDAVLDSVIESQEQVSADVAERIEDLSKKDSGGQVFNPEIHSTTRDGSPSLTSLGKFRLRKQRKDDLSDDDMERQTVSETSAGLFVQGGVVIFGDEWLPEDKKEFNRLVLAFDNYYKAAGVVHIPPSLGVIIAMGGYGIKRMAKPTTKEKIDKIKERIKKRLSKLFRRKQK